VAFLVVRRTPGVQPAVAAEYLLAHPVVTGRKHDGLVVEERDHFEVLLCRGDVGQSGVFIFQRVSECFVVLDV